MGKLYPSIVASENDIQLSKEHKKVQKYLQPFENCKAISKDEHENITETTNVVNAKGVKLFQLKVSQVKDLTTLSKRDLEELEKLEAKVKAIKSKAGTKASISIVW